MLRLFTQIDIEPPRNRLPCAISGHTIFEASTQNQTPTSLHASAKKTRMRNFASMFLVSFCPLLASGVALLTTHFRIQVRTLRVLNRSVPHSCGSTNCHGRIQSLPCWLCKCGPHLQACPSLSSFVQSVPPQSLTS